MLKYAFLFLFQIAFMSVFAQNNANTELDTIVQTGKYKLPAKVVLPKAKNFPIVIMLAGSGPSDKDVTIGPNKIFRDISEGFLKNNIASIRYDKRTLTKTKQKPCNIFTKKPFQNLERLFYALFVLNPHFSAVILGAFHILVIVRYKKIKPFVSWCAVCYKFVVGVANTRTPTTAEKAFQNHF